MAYHLRNGSDGRAALLVLSATVLGTCKEPAESVDASWLRAEVQGAVETVYEGSGYFRTGSDPRVSVKFTLNSDGVGPHAGQWLMLYRPGHGRPGEGAYALAPVEAEDGSPRGFTAYYGRTADDKAEAYTAVSGEVSISESSDNRVEGSFRFAAVRYCWSRTDGSPEGWCTSPNIITPGQPEVEVTGSFLAVPPPRCCGVLESRVQRP